MKKIALLFILISIVVSAFQMKETYLLPIPEKWPKPQYNFNKNPLTFEKIELGKALFYDPILSRDNSISCASCHSQYTAFTHVDHTLSHGIDDKIGNRNSPALMNLAWHKTFMWDGAVNHLDVQSLFPITHPAEMDEKIEQVVQKLQGSSIYQKLFLKAYNDSSITGEKILKSISQFMLTLISSNSKYDSVMRNESSFNELEKKGYTLFKKQCASCHTEPLFTNLAFENNGLAIDTTLNDYGRIKITKRQEDSLKFKVPTLRNIEFSYPYMHDGRFKKIAEVLNHYTSGVQHHPTTSNLVKKIILSSNEKVELTAFLLTLTDKHFLFDKKHSYPKYIFKNNAKE